MAYPDGRKTYYANGKATRIVTARGLTTLLTYDGSGRLTQIRDGYGRTATLNYGLDGLLTEIVHPDSGSPLVHTTLAYQDGELISVTDPLSHTTSFEYGTAHQVTKETLKNGRVYRCEYTTTSGLQPIDDHLEARIIWADRVNPPGPSERAMVVASTEFPALRHSTIPQSPVLTQDGNGFTWQYSREKHWGTLASMNPLSGVVAPGYDAAYENDGNPVNNPTYRRALYLKESGKLRRDFTWGLRGTLQQLVLSSLTNDFPPYVTLYSYGDSRFPGLVTRKEQPNGGVWEYTYNDKGDLIEERDAIRETPDQYTTHAYEYHAGDPPGRLKKILTTNRRGFQSIEVYDTAGNLILEDRYTAPGAYLRTEYLSDAMGRRTKEKIHRGDGSFAITRYEYDLMGRMTKLIENYVATTTDPNTENLTTEYTYDWHGLVVSVKSPRGYITTYEYDHRNNLSKKIEDSGAGGLALTTQYENDGNGIVKKFTDPRGNVTTIVNGPTNEPTEIDDAEGYKTRITRDAMGHITLVDREITADSGAFQVVLSSAYDGLGRPKFITRPSENDSPGVAYDYSFNVGSGGCGCNGLGTDQPYKTTRTIDGNAVGATFNQLDANGRLVKVIGKAANFGTPTQETADYLMEYSYDAEGNVLAEATSEATGTTSATELARTIYTYDGADRLNVRTVKATPFADLVTTYTLNGAGNVTSTRLPNGHDITYGYDTADRLLVAIDYEDPIGLWTYDASGNLLTESDAAVTVSYTYDGADRRLTMKDQLIESPDKFTSYFYDANGNRTSIVDNNGMRTCMIYDKINRLLRSIEAAGGSCAVAADSGVTDYEYDGRFLEKLKDKDGSTTEYDYDWAGRISQILYPPGVGSWSTDTRKVQFRYGQGTGNRGFERTDQRGVTTVYDFDAFGRLTGRTYSDATPDDTFSFDRAGRLRCADNGVSRMDRTYDLAGRPMTETQCYPVCSGGASYGTTISYTLDTSAHTLTRTAQYPNGGLPALHLYDHRGRMTLAEGSASLGEARTYGAEYLFYATRHNGMVDEYGYDDLWRVNRILRLAYPPLGTTPAARPGLGYAYDAVGNRLFSKRLDSGPLAARSEFYEYDSRHRLKVMRRGMPNSAGTGVGTNGYHSSLAYFQEWPNLDSRGNWPTFKETIGLLGQTVEEETPLEPPTRVHTRVANGVNEYTSLSIDPDGPGGASPWTTTGANIPAYDPAGNLLFDPSAIVAGNACAGLPMPGCGSGQEYEYDAENRVTAIRRDTDNQPPGGGGGGGLLAGLEPEPLVLEFKYDALGRRVETIEHIDPATGAGWPGGVKRFTRHIYAGLETIQEYVCGTAGSGCGTWTLAREFLWGDSNKFPDPVGMMDHTGAGGGLGSGPWPYHYLKDVLGSVVGLAGDYADAGTSKAGPARVLERYTYDPYGKVFIERWLPPLQHGGAGTWTASSVGCGGGSPCGALTYSLFGNPFGFTGHRYDASTGMYYTWGRTLSPMLGRWLQRDPMDYVDGVNLYEYVVSSPSAYVDPDGNGKIGLFVKSVKGLWKLVRPGTARKLVKKGTKEILIEGPGSSRAARKLAKDTIGKEKNIVRHDGHCPGQRPHYQAKSGDGRHVRYVVPGAAIGIAIFGENEVGEAADILIGLINPLSDVQDIVDLVVGDVEVVHDPQFDGFEDVIIGSAY